jgi:hypothetical protein
MVNIEFLMMKAKFVYENMKFERNQDPKESIGVGIHGGTWDFPNTATAAEFIVKNFQAISGGKFDEVIIEKGGAGSTDNRRVKPEHGNEIIFWAAKHLTLNGVPAKFSERINLLHDVAVIKRFLDQEKANNIKESIDFERGIDPKKAMDIGIKNSIRKWIDSVLDHWIEGNDYRINDDYTIEIFTGFEVPDTNLGPEFPDYIKMKRVVGNFHVDSCGLKSMRGFPEKVLGWFSCEQNELTSLEGMPKIIFGDIFIRANPGAFTKEDVLEYTENLGGRDIYSENSHVDESLEFNREGAPFDKLGIGKENVIELRGMYPYYGDGNYQDYSEDEVIEILKDWKNRSSAEIAYNTVDGKKLDPEDLDGKWVKYKGKFYWLPPYEAPMNQPIFTKDATTNWTGNI